MEGCSVLVVDDDPIILDTVAEVLDFEGYSVCTAQNGAEALEVIKDRVPNVVLLDMRMPIMDGWGFAAQVKERGIKVPILVMTAAQDARAWAREIAADGFVSKPFELDELLSAVERFCPEKDN